MSVVDSPSSSPPPPPARKPASGGARPGSLSAGAQAGRARRDQLFACVAGAALLAGSMLMQATLSERRKDWNLVREAPEAERSMRSLAVTFPRLTLGGFRGVVSTALWMQAEEDKNNRNWLDLETKYDIIGGLQPYFVSVYIYHSWNQAYNLSAQWQEVDTKYKWILDGLAYLYRGEDYNPGHADLFLETGHLYMLKLGGAFEKDYFRAHWRSDQARLYELNDKRLADNDNTVALKHVRDFVNHRDNRYKPDDPAADYLHIKELPDPGGKPDNLGFGISITDPGDKATGFNLFSARTDTKKPTDPMEFRYGVSPFYFAYREYLRAIEAGGPSMMSMHVLDAWPAMCLRLWARDDVYYIGQTMRAMFGEKPVAELLNNEARFGAKATELKDCDRNVQMIVPRAVELFKVHLGKFPGNKFVHTKHIIESESLLLTSKAEYKLFDTLVQWHKYGRKIDGSAKGQEIKQGFQDAVKYYKEAYPAIVKWADNVYPNIEGQPPNPDRLDIEKYANAAQDRIKGIEALLDLPPDQKPDMSFLSEDVVEK